MDGNDPLAPFRRGQQPAADDQAQQPLTEHRALKLAIEALNEVPNSRVRMEGYANTYKLIPDLEKAYRAGEEHTRLEALASKMYDTLLLCEDALTELGRTNDGTPSIQALMNIQVIKKEAGYPLPGPDLQQELENAAGKEFISTDHVQLTIGERIEASFRDDVNNQEGGWGGTPLAEKIDVAIAEEKASLLEKIARAPELLEENGQLKAINAELLEALQEIAETLELAEDYGFEHEVNVARAAIAKAVPERQQPLTEDRAQWETTKQLAIKAWENVTWEQAQEYIKDAYEVARETAEYSTGYSENSFVDRMNWHILEKNEAFSSAMKEIFKEHYSQEPQKDSPQSIVSMTDETRDARIRDADIEPEP